MGKKQKQNQKVNKVQPAKPANQIQVQEAKQQIVQRATDALNKFIPHEKYIIKKTKLISKKKNDAIAFIKVDKHQIAKAVICLKEFDKNHQNAKNLFTQDGFIYLQFDLSKVPESYSIRPVQIELPYPIYSQKYNSRLTIFSTDPQNTFTDKIQDLNIPQISQVIGYQKVKKNYKQNTDKLKLIAANDLFFCDWKIYNLLRQPLGKAFYEKKKYPFPIDCENIPQDLKSKFSTYEQYLNDLSNHTYFMMGNGPVYSIKIGRISMQPQQLVKNIMRGIFRTIPHILGKELNPSDVRQITIKTFNSPSLPIYNYLDEKFVTIYRKQQSKTNQAVVKQTKPHNDKKTAHKQVNQAKQTPVVEQKIVNNEQQNNKNKNKNKKSNK